MTSFVRKAPFLATIAVLAACGGSHGDASSSSPPGAPSETGSPPGACSPSAATDLEVAAGEDLDTYPPYAVNGCTLVYVAKSGALVARDLRDGREVAIAPEAEKPRRPAISPELVAWEATVSGKDVVRVLRGVLSAGEAPTTIDGFAAAREPRVSGTAIAFAAWRSADEKSDSDVYVYDASNGESRLVLGGAGQQRFADISSTFVAVTDFSEDPDGTFQGTGADLADIVLVERSTGAVTHRVAPGKQAFPLLVATDRVAYMHWGDIHPEPKYSEYSLKSGLVGAAPAADVTVAKVTNYASGRVRYAAADGILEWIGDEDGPGLYRAPADGTTPAARVAGLEKLQLFAPASSAGITVLATRPSAASSEQAPRLRSLGR